MDTFVVLHGVQPGSLKDWGVKTEEHWGLGWHWRCPQDETSPLSGWWKITKNTRTRTIMEVLCLWPRISVSMGRAKSSLWLPTTTGYRWPQERHPHTLFHCSFFMTPNCRPWLGQLSFLCYLNPTEDKYWSFPVKFLPLHNYKITCLGKLKFT